MGVTELGTESIMKILLVIALFGAVQAESDPGFFYHTGVPLVYTHPVVYANNVCTNEAGAVVPCANPVAPASGVYSFADAPAGLVPVVGAAAAPAAAEDAAVVSVEKRSADPQPWGYYGWGWGYPYRGHGGYVAGPASIADIDYGTTKIKYNVKREAEPEAEADADADAAADAWYGYYGHPGYYGYGYGYASPYYGYYGLGYRGYGYGYYG